MAAITDNDGFALTGGPAATAAYFGVQFKSKIKEVFWEFTTPTEIPSMSKIWPIQTASRRER